MKEESSLTFIPPLKSAIRSVDALYFICFGLKVLECGRRDYPVGAHCRLGDIGVVFGQFLFVSLVADLVPVFFTVREYFFQDVEFEDLEVFRFEVEFVVVRLGNHVVLYVTYAYDFIASRSREKEMGFEYRVGVRGGLGSKFTEVDVSEFLAVHNHLADLLDSGGDCVAYVEFDTGFVNEVEAGNGLEGGGVFVGVGYESLGSDEDSTGGGSIGRNASNVELRRGITGYVVVGCLVEGVIANVPNHVRLPVRMDDERFLDVFFYETLGELVGIFRLADSLVD